jgi:hypothetical protein
VRFGCSTKCPTGRERNHVGRGCKGTAMKVFISWSGERSKRVAQALRTFLQDVNQNIVPWLSEADIGAGSRWRYDLANALELTTFGIICLTSEAATSPWLLFEAGALSKSVQNGRVCPYLIGVEPKNLEGPLSQFQSKLADFDGTMELLSDINKTMDHGSLSDDRLKRYFDMFWPAVECVVSEVLHGPKVSPPRLTIEQRKKLRSILSSCFDKKDLEIIWYFNSFPDLIKWEDLSLFDVCHRIIQISETLQCTIQFIESAVHRHPERSDLKIFVNELKAQSKRN